MNASLNSICKRNLTHSGHHDMQTSAKYLAAYLMLKLGMAALQVSTLLLCIIPVFGQLTQLSLQVALLHTPLQ